MILRRHTLRWLLPLLCACTAPADHPTPPIEQWTIEPVLTIGGADSGAASITWLKSLDADQDGRILALEQESQRIEVFDSTGRHLRSIGRKGRGPGEFQNANGFRIAPDGAIWVNNPSNSRITIFNADGTLRRELSLRMYSYTIGEWEAWFDGDTLRELVDVRIDTTDVERIRSFRQQGSLVDTTALPCEGLVPRPTRDDKFILRNDQRTTSIPIPWKPQRVRVFDGRGHVWCGASDQYRLTRLTLAGGDTLRLEGNRTPSPVTPHDRDSVIDLLRRHVLTKLNLPEPDWSRLPATKPIIGQVRIDDSARVWVQVAIDGPVQRWEVFSATGRPIAEATSPVEFHIRGPLSIRGDTFYGVTMDSNDVIQVVRAKIHRH